MVSEDPLIPADRVIFETDEIYLKVCARVCVCGVHPITRGDIMRGLLIPGMKGMHVNTSYVHNFPAVVL